MDTEIEEIQKVDIIEFVKKSYLKSFVLCFTVAMSGMFLSDLINYYFSLSSTTIKILQTLSLVPGSTILFGVPPEKIQTWGGGNPAVTLNHKLVIAFSIIGLIFPAIAFQLKPTSSDDLTSFPRVESIKNDAVDDFTIVYRM